MSSPYRAHFEVRDKTRYFVFMLVLIALVAGGLAFKETAPAWQRMVGGAFCPTLLVISWGIHRAEEWARVGGIMLCSLLGIAALLAPKVDIGTCLFSAGTSAWLARPKTRTLFATAREMIRRTEEIQRDKAEKHAASKRARSSRA
jgi:hypothetical protein